MRLISQRVIKIRTLLPVLKENKRYILYEIDSKSKMNNPSNIIKTKLREFIGDLGLARAGLKFMDYKNNKGILQINNKSINDIKTGLSLIDEINNQKVRFRAVKVSGVLNKVKEMV